MHKILFQSDLKFVLNVIFIFCKFLYEVSFHELRDLVTSVSVENAKNVLVFVLIEAELSDVRILHAYSPSLHAAGGILD